MITGEKKEETGEKKEEKDGRTGGKRCMTAVAIICQEQVCAEVFGQEY